MGTSGSGLLLGSSFGTVSFTKIGALDLNSSLLLLSTMAVLTTTFSVFAISYIRTVERKNTERKLEEERDRLRQEFAQDLHDEIGNRLAKIITFSNVLEHNNYQLDNATKKLVSIISTNSQQLYNSAYDLIRSKQHDERCLDTVIDQLQLFGKQLFQDTPIKFSADIQTNRLVKLDQGQGRQISLIFKEAMTNALKHSQCHSLVFKVRAGYVVILELVDDGSGFSVDQKSSGMGLRGMNKRAEKINATLKIDSTTKGTKLKLFI